MKCPNCGQICRSNRKTCALCGAPLKKERKGLWTAVAILVLLLAGGALYLLWPRAAAPEPGEEPAAREQAGEPQPEALWTGVRAIYARDGYLLALCQDGTLRLLGQSGSAEFGFDLADWTNIVQVAPEDGFVAALTAGGRVRLTGEAYDYAAAARWTGVERLWISAGTLFGLTGEGRLLAAGPARSFDSAALSGVADLIPGKTDTLVLTEDGQAHVLPWLGMIGDAEGMSGIADVEVNGEFALYLMADGTVRPAESFRSSPYDWLDPYGTWQGVRELQLGDRGCLALTAEGRVLSTPLTAEGSVPDTSGWTDVRQLVYDRERNSAYGVTGDGRVLAAGEQLLFPEVQTWTDVADLQVCRAYAVALTADGRVLFTGDDSFAR